MKKPIVIMGLAVLAIALTGGFAAWYSLAGPAMTARTAKADKVLAMDRKARAAAEKALDEAAHLPDRWQNLSFDEQAERARIKNDLDAKRQFDLSNYRDPAAATVAKDIDSANKVLANAQKDLRASYKELGLSQQTYLPAKEAGDIESALTDNAAMSRNVKAELSVLKELKNNNYTWGHMAVVVKDNGEAMAALDKADSALKAGDYVALQDANALARASFESSAEWLTLRRQALVNNGIYPTNGPFLVDFVNKGLETTESFEQAAVFMFGRREDAASLKLVTERAASQLAAVQKTADTQQFGQGYKVWFLAAANQLR